MPVCKNKISLIIIIPLFICLLLPANRVSAVGYNTVRLGQTKNIDINSDSKVDLQVEIVKINPDGRPVIKLSRLSYSNYIYSINFLDYLTSLYTNMVIASAILSAVL